MIDLRDIEHQALRDLSRAGTGGLTRREIRISVAIRLQLASCAKIHSGVPQTVTITDQGAAFLRRAVFV